MRWEREKKDVRKNEKEKDVKIMKKGKKEERKDLWKNE